MQASIVELRTKMRDIAKALSRNETVSILSHGKIIGELAPISASKNKKKGKRESVQKHAFFGSRSENEQVEKVMENLRGGRYII